MSSISVKELQPNVTQVSQRGFVIVYDLPAEDRTDLKEDKNLKAYRLVRNLRITSGNRLRALGLAATESCVVSAKPGKTITQAKDSVIAAYDETSKELSALGHRPLDEPDIRAIEILDVQYQDFRSLAEAKLSKHLDETINGLANLTNTVNSLDAKAREKIAEQLERKERYLQTAEELAKELGINLSSKFDLAKELAKAVMAKV